MERLAGWLQEFDAQGLHRTGSDVDAQSAEWLVQCVRDFGASAARVGFEHARLDPVSARLEIGDTGIEGVPLFDGGVTGPEGVRGVLGDVGSSAPLGVATLAPGWEIAPGPAVLAARRAQAHRGLVVLAAGPKIGFPDGHALLNADDYANPFGPPALQLPSTAAGVVGEAVASAREATLVVHSTRTRVPAFNVELRVSGRDPGLAPLVIMTPRSAWWTCTSERGGGLVAWLECVRALASEPPARDVWCIATTGHELGHLGLDDFLARHDGLLSSAHAWLHLGANLGAAVRGSLRLQTSDEPLEALANDALATEGLAPDAQVRAGERPAGEARNVFDGNGRYVSLLGGNGLFHTPVDRWPDAIDLKRVSALARAVTRMATALAR